MPSRDWEDIAVAAVGSRNTELYAQGVRLLSEGVDDLRLALEELNQARMDPPLSLTEVASVVRVLERRALGAVAAQS